MQYEIEVGGRTRQVAVTRAGDGFAVSVDGRTSHVNAVRIDAYTMSLLIDSDVRAAAARDVAGKADATTNAATSPVASGSSRTAIAGSHEVTIAPDPATRQLTVRVDGTPITVSLNGRRRWGRKDEGGHSATGPQRVVAPMPGK